MKRYIYHSKNWPNFIWNKDEVNNALSEALAAKSFLLGQMQMLGIYGINISNLDNITQNIVKSAEIEGKKLNLQEVRSSIAIKLGLQLKNSIKSTRDIDGAVEMLFDALNNYSKPLTNKRLFGWHNCLFPSGYSGLYKISVGKYRDDKLGAMQVVSGAMGREKVHYEAPPAKYLPSYMSLFFNFVNNSKENLVIKAAIAHLWFVIIHPFEDGNGRIARAIADMLLAKWNKSNNHFYNMSAQIQKEKKAYYEILKITQKENLDITSWILWFINCLKKSIELSSQKIKRTVLKYQFLQDNKTESFNLRQKKIIEMLFEGFTGNLTSAKWAKINRVTQMTANRDIANLLARRVLVKHGRGKNTHYTLAD